MGSTTLILTLFTVLAASHGGLVHRAEDLTWNSFLGARNIFPVELNHNIELLARDATTSEVQLATLLSQAENLEKIYKNFQVEFKKSEPVTAVRMEILRKNLLKTAVHNAEARQGKHTWTMGITAFADWTKEELSRPALQLTKLSYNNSSLLNQQVLRDAPSSKDYRQDGVVTTPKNQMSGCLGGEGSCYAFAGAAVAESVNAIKGNTLVDLSVVEIVSCGNGQTGIGGCDGGDSIGVFMYMQNGHGLAQSSDTPPYANTTSPLTCPANINSVPHLAKVTGMQQEVAENGATEDTLLSILLEFGPVAVGVAVNDQYEGWSSYGPQSGIYDGPCGASMNHAVVVVGYTPDAWIIKNSWDTTWGDGGFMLLKRGVDKCFVADHMSVITGIQ